MTFHSLKDPEIASPILGVSGSWVIALNENGSCPNTQTVSVVRMGATQVHSLVLGVRSFKSLVGHCISKIPGGSALTQSEYKQ